MFSNLTDFSRRRSGLEALGFYIVYFLLGILLGGIAGGVGGLLTGVHGFKEGVAAGARWGLAATTIYVLLLGATICVRKSLHIAYYFVVGLAAFLALFGGGSLIGLIPLAFLTTRPTTADAIVQDTSH